MIEKDIKMLLRGANMQRRRGNLVWNCFDGRLGRFQWDCFVTIVTVPRNDEYATVSSELRVTCLELYDYIIENKTKVDETIEYFNPILYGNYAYKQVNLEGVVL